MPSPPCPRRNVPALPTPTELLCLAVYPSILVFGTVFSLLSPDTRAAPYDVLSPTNYAQGALAPSYFARKDNVFNVVFVKRGWAWVSAAFAWFVVTHPAFGDAITVTTTRRRAVLRWLLVTVGWVLVTQWCFGPPLMDRGFRWTGGTCEAAKAGVRGDADTGHVEFVADALTAAACRAAGGRWSGGHDISGHVFPLVLGSGFLLQEVGWTVGLRAGWMAEERSVVMGDGAVKRATVESDRTTHAATTTTTATATAGQVLGHGGRFAAGVVGLCLWMMLMTAIYFHTWFEKTTGLLVAGSWLYLVYIVPRQVAVLRSFIGLPGI